MTKLKKTNCDKRKTQIATKLKFQIVTTQKIKLWPNSKTQIGTLVKVTVLTVAVVKVVVVTYFSKNNLTPWQLMRYSPCSFSRCLGHIYMWNVTLETLDLFFFGAFLIISSVCLEPTNEWQGASRKNLCTQKHHNQWNSAFLSECKQLICPGSPDKWEAVREGLARLIRDSNHTPPR